MTRLQPNLRILAAVILLAGGSAAVRADIFVLENGGQVRGELTNRDESPRQTYQIKVAGGGQVTLEAAQVKEVKRQSAAEMKYDSIRGNYPDTVDGQWELAEWCQKNYLTKQRKTHLERIVELDPNHAAARRGLGYVQVGGRWVTQEMQRIENGYVRYKNTWVLPQEVEIREQEQKAKAAQTEWNTKLKRWTGWLGTDRREQAIAAFRSIDDPFAAGPIARFLNDSHEEPRQVRMLYVETLGRLNVPGGMDALVNVSLFDPDEEIRLSALDYVVINKYQPATRKYVQALKNKENPIINRAALGLGRMKDTIAVGPLIDALVTNHSYEIQEGQPGNMSSTFGTGPSNRGGGSFQFGGGGPKIVNEQVENRDVLQALVELSGVSFNFDRNAWRYWYASQRKTQSLDARRDGSTK